MIEDVIAEASRRLAAASRNRPTTCGATASRWSRFRRDVAEAEAGIKAFLSQRMYRHARVMRVMGEAEAIVSTCSRVTRRRPATAGGMVEGPSARREGARARRIGDFIAGMTDRFALTEHQRLFDSTPDLR